MWRLVQTKRNRLGSWRAHLLPTKDSAWRLQFQSRLAQARTTLAPHCLRADTTQGPGLALPFRRRLRAQLFGHAARGLQIPGCSMALEWNRKPATGLPSIVAGTSSHDPCPELPARRYNPWTEPCLFVPLPPPGTTVQPRCKRVADPWLQHGVGAGPGSGCRIVRRSRPCLHAVSRKPRNWAKRSALTTIWKPPAICIREPGPCTGFPPGPIVWRGHARRVGQDMQTSLPVRHKARVMPCTSRSHRGLRATGIARSAGGPPGSPNADPTGPVRPVSDTDSNLCRDRTPRQPGPTKPDLGTVAEWVLRYPDSGANGSHPSP